jgi:hypothetical protein
MIYTYYTRQFLDTNIKQPDFVILNTVDEFIEWLLKQGDRITFNLVSKNRILTHEGWKKQVVPSAHLIQAYDSTQKIFITINRIVSDEGVLFDNIKHCSKVIIDEMALKCVKA